MDKKIKLTKILAIISFVIFVISLLLPYTKYRIYGIDPNAFTPSGPGYKEEFVLLFVFTLPLLIFSLIRHSLFSRVICLIVSIIFFIVVLIFYNSNFKGDYQVPAIGFYMLIFVSLLFLAISILKMTIPVPIRKPKTNELLDNF